jgi:amidohydrolase
VANAWQTVVRDATDLRRRLHRHPELAWSEITTAAAIRDELDRLGIAWRACAGTGTVATLAGSAPGRHVALRSDIDAMPVQEDTGAPYTSEIDGMMHACGHDGHTATLVATAAWLRAHESRLPGPVTLLFQPAEEGGHGAKGMIEDGALDGVDVVFGWHNWPAIPFGRAVCPDGPVMAGNGTFEIVVSGVGGHASQPEATKDPVLAAAAITVALQQVVSRRLAPQQSTVVAVTSIDAPSAATVTPATARLGGSIRIVDEETRVQVQELIDDVTHHTATAHGCTAQVVHTPRYGPTVNHAGPAGELRDVLAAELGSDWWSPATPVPVMASEDFSYYLGEVPGAFALVGADDGDHHDASCHSPQYDFNDRLIPRVVRVYARLAGAPLPQPT